MPKKVLIALPSALLEKIDYIAKAEHRTRSDLIRESLRRYLNEFQQRHVMAPHLTVTTFEEDRVLTTA